jgi:hypothetical protein
MKRNAVQIKIRKGWGILNPNTRKIKSHKLYRRKLKWGTKWY